EEANAFLTSLAVADGVSASTQNQALCALIFLYKDVLDEPLPWLHELVRAKRPRRLPVVLTQEEVRDVLAQMRGNSQLVAQLLYGSGLRLLECLQLLVKDIDFGRNQLMVRDPKGKHDRVTMLPKSAIEPLRAQLLRARATHDEDL